MKQFSKKSKILIIAGLLLVLGVFAVPSVFAQTGPNAQLVNLNFPCPTGMSGCAQLTNAANSPNPIGTFLNSFYQLALTVSGLLALLMIVAGGVKYTISSGSADKQTDAKDMIISALYGVALLLGSYLILNTINPQITALTLPGSEPQFGAVATSGPSISVPITECIPLNSNTWDPNNTSTLATSTNYSALNYPTTYLGNGYYDSKDASSVTNCKNRVFITNQTLTISNDDYYDVGLGNIINRLNGEGGTVVIDPGSTIWQYPYFPSKSTNPSADARCLIYAYQDSGSTSSATMVGLNPSLQLCYPHNQTINITGANATAECTDQASCAARYYYQGYVAHNAPNTDAFLQCIPKELRFYTSGPYTLQESGNKLCNYTRGLTVNGQSCIHAFNSCHYGGSWTGPNQTDAGNIGSLAVDFDFNSGPNKSFSNISARKFISGIENNCRNYIKDARCETSNGTLDYLCIDDTDTHVHVTIQGCNSN
jgi:hypothetical protein